MYVYMYSLLSYVYVCMYMYVYIYIYTHILYAGAQPPFAGPPTRRSAASSTWSEGSLADGKTCFDCYVYYYEHYHYDYIITL